MSIEERTTELAIQELKKFQKEHQTQALASVGVQESDTGDHARPPAKRKASPPDDNSDSKDIPIAKSRLRQTKSSPTSGAPTPAPARIKLVSSRITARERKKWEAPYVFTDTRSPLAYANLREMLLLPEAWDLLTPEEKADILSKFPDDRHILNAGTPESCPNRESLRNDDNFRHDCARYCENIAQGRHDEEWLEQAWVAHQRHVRGDFDEHLQKRFEEDWGVKPPSEQLNEHPSKRPRSDENSPTLDTGTKRSWSTDSFMDSYLKDMIHDGSSSKKSPSSTSAPGGVRTSSENLVSETSGSNGPSAVDSSPRASAPDASSPTGSSFAELIPDIMSSSSDLPGYSPRPDSTKPASGSTEPASGSTEPASGSTEPAPDSVDAPTDSPDSAPASAEPAPASADSAPASTDNHDDGNDDRNDDRSISLKGGELDSHPTQDSLTSPEAADGMRLPGTKDENGHELDENYSLHAHFLDSSTPLGPETILPTEGMMRDSENQDSCDSISSAMPKLKLKPSSSPSHLGPVNTTLNHARPNGSVFINSEENDIVAYV
ncbi:Asx homology domain-containing protein [Cercophora scortea]|uniref:Asx homology domain-containing protein n=1 Tax=Cercophora scortea TaxID=314031 RepID=A0AAE0IM35_9PEZI|nr:Asx homology domain-containing protein [Cercophora scortea]